MSSVAGRWSARSAARRRPSPLDAVLTTVVTRDGFIVVAVAAVLCLLAFVAQSGVQLEHNTWMEVVLVAGGGLLGAAALAVPHRRAHIAPLHGGRTLGLFGVLTALTALSIAWSIDPDASWLEANRTLSYLAAFGGALAFARIAPTRWGAVLAGVGLACTIVCVWALLTKVFPEALAGDERAARLRAPFGYWNAVGLMAAMGVPPTLWLASRRSGHAAFNALAFPALGALLVCLLLAYSRGAILALLVGLVFWFAVVPLRLRGAAALVLPLATAIGVVAWAFGADGISQDDLLPAQRADAGLALGVLLVLQFVVLLAAGLLVGFLGELRGPPTERVRQTAGRTLVVLVAAAAIAGVVAVGMGDGGYSGAVKRLTDPNVGTPSNSPNRLVATSSVRARYWDEAFKIHAATPWLGAGTGAYATGRLRYRTGQLDVQHAHGYVPQTLADLGWFGFAASLAAMLAWLASAAGVVGLRRADRRARWDAERVGMAGLVTVVLVFGVHSAVDWTWFIPANAVAGLICAGFVCGRPPLRRRLSDEGPTGLVGAAEQVGVLPPSRRYSVLERMRAWQPSPYRAVLAVGVLLIGGFTCWSIVQPLRAVNAEDAAASRLDAGQYEAATDIALIAQKRNPLSVEPWFLLAGARSSVGDEKGALLALVEAVKTQPANPEPWQRLAEYELTVVGDPKGALQAFQAAYFLDRQAPGAASDVIRASRAAELVTD